MKIDVLKVTDFRNIESIELSPHPNFNVIHGLNGQGKTNLLESICGYQPLEHPEQLEFVSWFVGSNDSVESMVGFILIDLIIGWVSKSETETAKRFGRIRKRNLKTILAFFQRLFLLQMMEILFVEDRKNVVSFWTEQSLLVALNI